MLDIHLGANRRLGLLLEEESEAQIFLPRISNYSQPLDKLIY